MVVAFVFGSLVWRWGKTHGDVMINLKPPRRRSSGVGENSESKSETIVPEHTKVKNL